MNSKTISIQRSQQCVPRTVLIQKPDLDTCLTGLILDITATDHIITKCPATPDSLLKNKKIICIECGGSGQDELNNFDHHDPQQNLPAACRQALITRNLTDQSLVRLVEYVEMIDGCSPLPSQRQDGLYLSHLFSGVLLSAGSIIAQFLTGMAFLQEILHRRLDPFAEMPLLPQWKTYCLVWRNNKQLTAAKAVDMLTFATQKGKMAGLLENPARGGFGHIYSAGCEIGILFCPWFGPDRIKKYTIGSQRGAIDHLLPILNNHESGWGGRQTIIGSPYSGSILRQEEIIRVIKEHC